jgi:hypothetical protein
MRKNPSTRTKIALAAGAGAVGLVAFVLYRRRHQTALAPAAAAAATLPAPATAVSAVTDTVKNIASGISDLFSGASSVAGAMSDVDKIKAYQKQLNALGAKLVVDGIVGTKTLTANNAFMPVKYTTATALRAAIVGGVAGVAGLGNYFRAAR